MTGSLDIFLYLSMGLFAVGALGVLVRRNALLVLMCIELMLNAVNMAFVTFSRGFAGTESADAAQVFVLMIMGVAAAEAAIGIAIVVTIFRARGHIDLEEPGELKG